ncbi:arsenic resistance N-acetyltransferase ArsN2 (plasmid) [Sphingomonas naphthae]|uniref:Arsenic resistance N-acetyltransferase ArsN2 n=1 Tax=Sphingomonas naphthae TaxID=1813468 RepID=A0ABY7TRJ2_9SPHN|nr:arsenic resistance N-acetyltransferase ArsN2 [Sphingomonas naphthae]WCT75808.1 arsenic resistance N-acetyltransferase ArsN2 [Sphingomonas naphthae]
MNLVRLDPEQLAALADALEAASLPTSDLEAPDRQFYRFEDAIGMVGYGGLEGRGPDRLLRSVVVTTERRGTGLGGILLGQLEHAAADGGATSLYLLTTTAEGFFRRAGYMPVERTRAPEPIANSAEFRSLCPASAAFLFKRIC